MNFALLFVLVAVLVVAVVVFAFIATKKRRERTAAFAAARGLRYEQRNDSYVGLDWGAPFARGHSRHADYVLSGTLKGRPVLCFEYQFTETSGAGDNRSSTTYRYSVFSTAVHRSLPRLGVGREGLGSKIAKMVGVKDIELESEEFNKTFKVDCKVPKFAYDVLHPRMMEWMLQTDAPGFRVVDNNFIVIRGGRLDLESVDGTFAYLDSIILQVPQFVWTS